MKIALFGYGKMGKMIEQIAMARGHEIVAKVDIGSDSPDFDKIDLAIDFSIPRVAFENIRQCLENSVPIVSGTTGWLEQYDQAVSLCEEQEGAFIYASNFSLGVNVFFALNVHLAKMMRNLDDYYVSLEEIHHTQKLDAPSGTAISLAEGLISNSDFETWELNGKDKTKIPIMSKRIGTTPGTHTVNYESNIDSIEIKHTAHNREGFALGAIIAAEWLLGKTGVFTMKDVLNLG